MGELDLEEVGDQLGVELDEEEWVLWPTALSIQRVDKLQENANYKKTHGEIIFFTRKHTGKSFSFTTRDVVRWIDDETSTTVSVFRSFHK
jgi:hypothetical protein